MTHFAFNDASCLSGITIFDASCLWRTLYLTHIVFFVQYIQNIWGIFSEFLCKMLYMCSVFYMIFVQFLGVIKCLNNPFCAKCRLAHTKNPHRKNFELSTTTIGGVHQEPHLMQGLRICKVQSILANRQPNDCHTDHEIVPTDHEIILSYTDNVYPYRCGRFRNSREKSL